jgi:hypothetical protein
MKLKWKDAEPEEGYLPRSNANFAGMSVEVLGTGSEVAGSVAFEADDAEMERDWGPRRLYIKHTGSLSRGKALAESLAAWWLEQKPMQPTEPPAK